MRDPERIDAFCAELARCWHKVPDWRFGQLISNICPSDPFYIEDDKMIKRISDFFEDEGEE